MTDGPMSSTADSWQLVLFGGAALLILFKMWRGWKLGLVRGVASLVALVLAWIIGLFGGKIAAPFIRVMWPGLEGPVVAVAGVLLGVVVYLGIKLVSAIVFKKTEHQSVGLVRFGYGLTGALVGVVHGLLLVWMAAIAIRLLGSVAEAQIAVEKSPQFRGKAGVPVGAALRGLAGMKHALEKGALGAVVQQVDPVPAPIYSSLGKAGRVVSDMKSIERFTHYPGVRPLMEHPKIAALISDPEISRAAVQRNLPALLWNPRLAAAVKDPELAAALRKFEFEKALDYALSDKPEGKQ